MDIILSEMGEKWKTLSKDQQVALAQAVAGVRQYNQLVSLMDNWDIFEQNLQTAYSSAGSLDEQAEIYSESWQAAAKRVKASFQDIYDSIINDEAFIDLLNGIESIIDKVGTLIDSIGGLKGIALATAAVFTKVFKNQIHKSIDSTIYNVRNFLGANEKEIAKTKEEIYKLAKDSVKDNGLFGVAQANSLEEQLKLSMLLYENSDKLSDMDKARLQGLLDINKALNEQSVLYSKMVDEAEQEFQQSTSTIRKKYRTAGASTENFRKFQENAREEIQEAIEIQNELDDFYRKNKTDKGIADNTDYTEFQEKAQDFLDKGILKDKTVLGYLENLADGKDRSKMKEALEVLHDESGALESIMVAQADRLRDEAKAVGIEITEQMADTYVQKVVGVLEAEKRQQKASENTKVNASFIERFIDEAKNSVGKDDAIQKVIDTTQHITSLGFAFTSLKYTVDELNNTELSFFDRIMTSIFGLLPASLELLSILDRLKDSGSLDKIGGKIKGFSKNAKKDFSSTGFSIGKISELLPKLISGFMKLGKIAKGGTIAGAVMLAITAFDTFTTTSEEKIEKYNKLSGELATTAEELKSEYQELSEINTRYVEGKKGLEELTKGTTEYKEALMETNQAALELLEKFPELSHSWDEGLIKISNSDIEKQLRLQQNKTAAIMQASGQFSYQSKQVSNEEEFNKLTDTLLSKGNQFINFNPEEFNPEETKTSYLSREQAENIIDKLVNSEDKSLLLANKEYMQKELNLTQKQVDILWENKESIEKLGTAITDTVNAQDELNNQTAKQILSETAFGDSIKEKQMIDNGLAGQILGITSMQEAEKYKIGSFSADWKTEKEILTKQLGLSNQEAATLKLSGRGNVSYQKTNADGTTELIKMSKEQVAAILGSIDASNNLEKTMLSLGQKVEVLNKSNLAYERAYADFLVDRNLKNATRKEVSSLKEEVGYNSETGSYNKVRAEEIAGITGTKKQREEKLKQLGFEDAESYHKALQESFAVQDWEPPKGLSKAASEAMTLGMNEELKAITKDFGKEYETAYVEGINEIYKSINASEMSDQERNAFNDAFNSIDFTIPENGIYELTKLLQEYGVEIDLTSEKMQKFIEIFAFSKIKENTESLITNLNDVQNVVKDTKLGDILSDEDYQKLTKYNKELEKYFITLADGSHLLAGDPLDFQQDALEGAANNLLNQSKVYQKKADAKKSTIEGINPEAIEAYSSQVLMDKFNPIAKDRADEYLDTQLKILKANQQYYNDNRKQIDQWQEAVDQGTATADTYKKISESVQELGKQYNDIVKEASDNQAIANGLAIQAGLNMSDKQLESQRDSFTKEQFNAIGSIKMSQDEWENLDLEEVQAYSDYLQEVAKSLDYLSDELAENAEAAEDLAIYASRLNKGMDTLINNWENWGDVLYNSSKESEEYSEAMIGVKGALSDILSVQEKFISNNFVEQHLADIEAAAYGSVEAIDRLKSAMATDILMQVTLNDQDLRNKVLDIHNNILSLLPQDIEIGAVLSDEKFISAAQNLVDTAHMTAEEAQTYFNSIGYKPIFKRKKIEQKTTVPEYTIRPAYTPIPHTYTGLDGKKKTINFPMIGMKAYQSGTTEFTQSMDVGSISTNASDSPIIEGLEYVGGGSGPLNNYSSMNAGGAPAYSGGGDNNSGSGGESNSPEPPTPSEAMDYTKQKEIIDRYYEITTSIEDMTDALDDASDAADRLYGKDRIKQMEKQKDLLKDQQKLLQQYRKEISDYLAKDKAALQNNKYGIKFSFDDDGDITNYTNIMTNLYNQLHAAEQKYNSFATKDEQDAYNKSTLEPLNKKIEEIKELINTYDDTKNLLVDVDNQIQDSLNSWQDKNLEILTYKVELQIEVNDIEQEKLDYFIKKYSDNFYKMAESQALLGDSYPLLSNNLATYQKEVEELNKAYQSGEISQSGYIESLKEVNSNILENLGSLVELDKQMIEYYSNTLDSAQNELGKFTSQLEHQASILEHYKSVISLIGKENDFKMINSILQGQYDVASNQLKVQMKYLEALQKQKKEIESSLAKATGKEKEGLQKQLEAIIPKLNEAEQDVFSLKESIIELSNSILENDLAKFAKGLEEGMLESLGFNSMDKYLETIDRLNASQEEYLTTTNKIYETNKLIRQAEQDLADTDSLIAKQKYKDYIQNIKKLSEQNRLSKYELEIAQARYEVLKAEIALEEVKNAKDSMRLMRDSSGNWNYVYTANQDKIDQAQQALEDAQNNLYNIGLNGAKDYQSKYAEIMQEAFEAFKEIEQNYKDGMYENDQEYNQARTEAQEYYYSRLKDIQELYQVSHGLMVEESYQKEEDYIFAGIGSLEDFANATDKFLGNCNTAFNKWKQNSQIATDGLTNSMGNLNNKIDKVTNASENLSDQITDNLIPSLEQELDAVRDITQLWLGHRDALFETMKAYEKLQSGIQTTINSAAGVNPGGMLPNIPEQYQQDYGAIMAAYIKQGGNTEDEIFQELLKQRNEKVEWLQAHGFSSDYYGTYGSETEQYFKEIMSGGGDREWFEYAANIYTLEQIREILKRIGISTFKTGGYTGDWGDSGKLSILHEKELVLNQNDTKNLLETIKVNKDIKSGGGLLNKLSNLIRNTVDSYKDKIIKLKDSNNTVEQKVDIQATFPNVTNSSEIEQAFNNLVNQAAQYSSLNRK